MSNLRMPAFSFAADSSNSIRIRPNIEKQGLSSKLSDSNRPAPLRTWSLPPASPTSHEYSSSPNLARSKFQGTMTPPTTPTKPVRRRLSASSCEMGMNELPPTPSSSSEFDDERLKLSHNDEDVFEAVSVDGEARSTRTTPLETLARDAWPSWGSIDEPRRYEGQYDLFPSYGDESGFEEFGRGVWSVVYRAVQHPTQINGIVRDHGLPSPQSSPSWKEFPQNRSTTLIAIKAASRHDAKDVLKHEARILTYLQPESATHQIEARNYTVTFYGFEARRSAIILDAVPLTLHKYSKDCAKSMKSNFSTATMTEPVIGTEQWLSIAEHLISGLQFLQKHNIVHGDVKPQNILLKRANTDIHQTHDGDDNTSNNQQPMSYTPLYCDFSSSHHLSPFDTTPEVSAVTTDYTSPELLNAFYHRAGALAIATPASDVFALGVTLITAATGESPYSGARIEMQKVSMAKEGRPLDFARCGGQASRVMKGGVVQRVVEGTVKKNVEERIGVEEWVDVVRDIKGK
ncbi:MAG: hypothetical protein M1827_004194 [Pycnora praestabilis]|nr:MAG: hypothetical protein M1827_004194 [Pycnora praestabilis]